MVNVNYIFQLTNKITTMGAFGRLLVQTLGGNLDHYNGNISSRNKAPKDLVSKGDCRYAPCGHCERKRTKQLPSWAVSLVYKASNDDRWYCLSCSTYSDISPCSCNSCKDCKRRKRIKPL